MELKPLTYKYKTQKDTKSHIGLVAQDVELVYPELVNYNIKDDRYHLNYSGFGVIAIKAIQELKTKVDILEAENKKLNKKLESYEALANTDANLNERIQKMEALLQRIVQLENATTSNNTEEVASSKK